MIDRRVSILVVAALLSGCGGAVSGIDQSALHTSAQPLAHGTYRILYNFGSEPDGSEPSAGLVASKNRLLYGTTTDGGGSGCGGYGCGTVFKITTRGAEKPLYDFQGAPDGLGPVGTLLLHDGTLYGVTVEGGAGTYYGTVYAVDASSGKERILHSFTGGSDGNQPLGRLVWLNGLIYGTTVYGGKHELGVVFSITPSGTERVIHDFHLGKDGANPFAGLTVVNGNLYGTTQIGGKYNQGTVFSVTPSGKEQVLYSFRPGSGDGQGPAAELTPVAGELYGTTAAGGLENLGTVFEVSTAGLERVLHNFRGPPDDGNTPRSTVTFLNGALYGVTSEGGLSDLRGVLYSLNLSGRERVRHNFRSDPDGVEPVGTLLAIQNTLFGTTVGGGATGEGTVYTDSFK